MDRALDLHLWVQNQERKQESGQSLLRKANTGYPTPPDSSNQDRCSRVSSCDHPPDARSSEIPWDPDWQTRSRTLAWKSSSLFILFIFCLLDFLTRLPSIFQGSFSSASSSLSECQLIVPTFFPTWKRKIWQTFLLRTICLEGKENVKAKWWLGDS